MENQMKVLISIVLTICNRLFCFFSKYFYSIEMNFAFVWNLFENKNLNYRYYKVIYELWVNIAAAF